jgi:hypothetical protein
LLVFGRADGRLLDCPNTVYCANPDEKPAAISGFAATFDKMYQKRFELSDQTCGVQTYVTADGHTAMHIINYHYDQKQDRLDLIEKLTVTIGKTGVNVAAIHMPEGNDEIKSMKTERNGETVFEFADFPLYAVIEFAAVI